MWLWPRVLLCTLSARIIHSDDDHGGIVGNLDFTDHAGFSWYCVLLLVSGVGLLVLGLLPGLTVRSRVANVLVGAGFLGYAAYLVFAFHGGSYVIFFQAFIVPVLLIANTVRDLRSANLRRRANKRFKSRQRALAGDLAREQAEIQAALTEAQARYAENQARAQESAGRA